MTKGCIPRQLDWSVDLAIVHVMGMGDISVAVKSKHLQNTLLNSSFSLEESVLDGEITDYKV